MCHPHHSHPAAPLNPKTLCEPAALCLGRPKNKASDPRIEACHASLLGALKSARPQVHRPSSTFLHVADLPKASTKPCRILTGRNMSSNCRAKQTELLTTVTSPTVMPPTPGPVNRPEGLDRLAKTELEQKLRRQSGGFAARWATIPRRVDRFQLLEEKKSTQHTAAVGCLVFAFTCFAPDARLLCLCKVREPPC